MPRISLPEMTLEARTQLLLNCSETIGKFLDDNNLASGTHYFIVLYNAETEQFCDAVGGLSKIPCSRAEMYDLAASYMRSQAKAETEQN